MMRPTFRDHRSRTRVLREYDLPAPRPRPRNYWITKPILHSRGWTDTAIRDFLPKPQRYRDNPHPEGARHPMPLWRAETVARAESAPEWRAWLERSLRRRRKTLLDLTATIKDPAFRRRASTADTAITAHQRWICTSRR